MNYKIIALVFIAIIVGQSMQAADAWEKQENGTYKFNSEILDITAEENDDNKTIVVTYTLDGQKHSITYDTKTKKSSISIQNKDDNNETNKKISSKLKSWLIDFKNWLKKNNNANKKITQIEEKKQVLEAKPVLEVKDELKVYNKYKIWLNNEIIQNPKVSEEKNLISNINWTKETIYIGEKAIEKPNNNSNIIVVFGANTFEKNTLFTIEKSSKKSICDGSIYLYKAFKKDDKIHLKLISSMEIDTEKYYPIDELDVKKDMRNEIKETFESYIRQNEIEDNN